jgi:hypothetical protein
MALQIQFANKEYQISVFNLQQNKYAPKNHPLLSHHKVP